MNDHRRCDRCKWWTQRPSDYGDGECLRFPPQIVRMLAEDDNGIARSFFPRTYRDERCGEFEQSPFVDALP
jgi:hypothetical protein